MSNQLINHPAQPRLHEAAGLHLAMVRMIVFMVLLAGAGLLPPGLYAEAPLDAPPPLPLLVRAHQGDTPASIARRYLNDASKGWMIGEYNDTETLSGGQAILVPVAPFQPGGLTPYGYQTIPVLAYADIGETSGTRRQVSQAAFSRQMQWLKTEGFSAITPVQLIHFMDLTGQLPRRSVLITFDTTSQRLYDIGIPILKNHGFTATVFLATNDVGSEEAMNWDQIRQLQNTGFTIACRGRSGQSLTRRTNGQAFKAYFNAVDAELRLGRKTIETHLGTACQFLAYPHGHTSRLVSAMVAKIGFSAAFLLEPGDNSFFADRFGIHRTIIDNRTDPERFGKMLSTRVKADLN